MTRAISIMVSVVADPSCSSMSLEIEVLYEDGSTKAATTPLRRSVRLDLDTLSEKPAADEDDSCGVV